MATYYINADTGVNSGAGGSGAPWLTLAYAIAHSSAGDTIVCQKSTAAFAWVQQTIADRIITTTALGDAIFDGAGAGFYWFCSGILTLNNLWFRNALGANYVPFFIPSDTLTMTFTGCRFSNLTTSNLSYGALIGEAGGATLGTFTFTNCEIYDFKRNSGVISYSSMFGACLSLTLNNCTAYLTATGNANVGYLFAYMAGMTITVKNLIVHNASGATVSLKSGTGATATYSYSDFYLITSSPSGTGVITSDPLFIDAPNGNFNLRPTSPCIDAGEIV